MGKEIKPSSATSEKEIQLLISVLVWQEVLSDCITRGTDVLDH